MPELEVDESTVTIEEIVVAVLIVAELARPDLKDRRSFGLLLSAGRR